MKMNVSTLKVVHINTSGTGGAAIACHRLHTLMKEHGVQSDVMHLYNNYPEDENFHALGYTYIRRLANRAVYEVVTRDLKPEAYVFSEMAPLSSHIARHPLVLNADVIYLHWVLGGFFSYRDFEAIAKLGKPVFCFTHDMWWITGGCHHAFECAGYKSGCNRCPKHRLLTELTQIQSARKKRLFSRYPNIHFISPSEWLKQCVDDSWSVGSGRCSFIPNIVPDAVFKYRPKDEARRFLQLPTDKVIILFGTADNTNKVKGMQYLIEALRQIRSDQILLCVYGSDHDEGLVNKVSCPIRFLGRLSDPAQVAMADAAADLFISPTLAESFGQTLLENIKCGTPVISTRVAAVPEIVKEGINGYLVEPKNSDQIHQAIVSFINDPMVLDGSFDEIFTDREIFKKHLDLIQRKLNR
jgi:glycosyltransferase involved in cell wall biosynthesis